MAERRPDDHDPRQRQRGHLMQRQPSGDFGGVWNSLRPQGLRDSALANAPGIFG